MCQRPWWSHSSRVPASLALWGACDWCRLLGVLPLPRHGDEGLPVGTIHRPFSKTGVNTGRKRSFLLLKSRTQKMKSGALRGGLFHHLESLWRMLPTWRKRRKRWRKNKIPADIFYVHEPGSTWSQQTPGCLRFTFNCSFLFALLRAVFPHMNLEESWEIVSNEEDEGVFLPVFSFIPIITLWGKYYDAIFQQNKLRYREVKQPANDTKGLNCQSNPGTQTQTGTVPDKLGHQLLHSTEALLIAASRLRKLRCWQVTGKRMSELCGWKDKD